MILYNGDKSDITNFESTSFLQINNCGIQIMNNDGKKCFRKKGRVDFHILYVCEGDCQVVYNGVSHTLEKGNFVLYPPYFSQEYTLYTGSKSIWLHFNGFEAENILSEAKVNFGVHNIPYVPMLEQMLLRIIENNNKSDIPAEKGLLLSFFYSLGKVLNNDYYTEDRISDCIRFITMHYNTNISITKLAELCNLSDSRFLHLFKSVIKMSPNAYQQKLRLDSAKHMLSSTGLTVSEISAQSGYDDPLYFSRVFKQKTGISPTKYRELHSDK